MDTPFVSTFAPLYFIVLFSSLLLIPRDHAAFFILIYEHLNNIFVFF